LVDLIIEAIKKPSYSGVYNGTAPKPVTMAQLCSSVGGVLGRPSWLPVPDFAITTLLGEGAQVSARSILCSLVGRYTSLRLFTILQELAADQRLAWIVLYLI
jgi:hypothetical protein